MTAREESTMNRFSEKLTLPSGSRLELDLGRVEVALTGWDREELVVAASTPVDLVEMREGVRIAARQGRGTRLEISAPRHLVLVVADDASDLSLHGFSGRLELASRGGRIEGSDLRGELDLRVDRGRARLRQVLAKLDVSCGRGSVELGLLGVAEGSRVRVDGGRVDLDVPEDLDASFGTHVRGPWRSLTVRADFGAGGTPVELDVRRGELRLLRDGKWKGTLRPRGEVRLQDWDERRRGELRKLVSRLHNLRKLARR
jgi:hypothetical protein